MWTLSRSTAFATSAFHSIVHRELDGTSKTDINMFFSSSTAPQVQPHTQYRRPKWTCLRSNTDPRRLLQLYARRSVWLRSGAAGATSRGRAVCPELAATGPRHSCTADTALTAGVLTYYITYKLYILTHAAAFGYGAYSSTKRCRTTRRYHVRTVNCTTYHGCDRRSVIQSFLHRWATSLESATHFGSRSSTVERSSTRTAAAGTFLRFL